MTSFHCSYDHYLEAKELVRELGYPVGCTKWEMFWHGFRTWARGGSRDDCPIPDITDEERAEGRRTPHTRGAWMKGFEAARWRPSEGEGAA